MCCVPPLRAVRPPYPAPGRPCGECRRSGVQHLAGIKLRLFAETGKACGLFFACKDFGFWHTYIIIRQAPDAVLCCAASGGHHISCCWDSAAGSLPWACLSVYQFPAAADVDMATDGCGDCHDISWHYSSRLPTSHHYPCLRASKYLSFAKRTNHVRWYVDLPITPLTFVCPLLSETL